MERCFRHRLICTTALLLSTALGAEETVPAAARTKAPQASAPSQRVPASLEAHLSDPTILSPQGFAADGLEAHDDFLHRAVAHRRIELLRFVDRDDRRVFLGLTKEGYLGIHVQKRDR